MFKRRVVLHFPKELVDKPIVYRLVKDFNLEFNILKAEVNPREEGVLVLEIKGEDADLEKGMEYLKKSGVRVQPLSQDVSMDRNKCVDCTICIPLCPTQALVRNDNFEVEFIKERCIACGICISVCPYKAMSIRF
ncbi:MAG: (Fe-S)-binding protein [Candidatus Omnitrophota bacterium]|nr:4Fe-4S binding protein [Candidatus Omnitrophota bacterium]RKY37903.1 MAG: (Fe-S)-binding protein [Candidatus Omnitrophota bacterium]